jgi:hypothetical protein
VVDESLKNTLKSWLGQEEEEEEEEEEVCWAPKFETASIPPNSKPLSSHNSQVITHK